MGRNKNRDNQNASQEAEKTEAALPQLSEGDILNGSSIHPGIVKVAGFELQLGQVVRAAWQKSGLSVEEWNALPNEARDAFIDAEIDVVEEGGEAIVAADNLAPANGEQLPVDGDVKSGPADEVDDTPVPPTDAETPVGTIDEPTAEAGEVDPADAPVAPKVDSVGAWVRGVLVDYVSVMGEGKYPSPEQGAKQQANLLHVCRKLSGLSDPSDTNTSAFGDIAKFFSENKDGLTSERNLRRFVSQEDGELLVVFASRA
jgi:hypothetical protein